MKNVTDIQARIKSVGQTRQITGAMETISVAKMRKATARYERNRDYFEVLRRTIADIATHSKNVESRYLRPRKIGNTVYVVIASDKGLAGGFNHALLEYAVQSIEQDATSASVYCVGYMAREYFLRRNIAVDETFVTASYDPSVRDAKRIADTVLGRYDAKEIDAVNVVYTHLYAGSTMQPQCLHLLPLSPELFVFENDSPEAQTAFRELEFDPSPAEVMEMLIPQYLTGLLYGALIQSAACEHRARRDAMNSATANADRILEELNIEYHRARQEAVTNELSEIITAAMGVNNEEH